MNTPKISIIVPVYNTEKLLPRTLHGILTQTFTDFEVLLINDGSTDNSGKICDEYAKRDSRIRVFHKENEGVGSARQLGVIEAKGVYSTHIDSDDWVEPNMLLDMYKQIATENSDILITDYYLDNKYMQRCSPSLKAIVLAEDILRFKAPGSVWGVLIKHKLYFRYNLSFSRTVYCGEDILVMVELLLNEPKVSFLPQAYYHYSQDNNNSLTRGEKSRDKLYNRSLFLSELKSLLVKYNLNISLISNFNVSYRLVAIHSGLLSEEEYKLLFIDNNSQYDWKVFGFWQYVCLKLTDSLNYKAGMNLYKKLCSIKYTSLKFMAIIFMKVFLQKYKDHKI
ncbi:Undecaprenyl-phosphate 4-deoxy-4-formamido-L-arabinose transferase [Legionella sp. PC1000]|uniref:glycosyltransferase family 2 protein n=1 Tax=Legionella sp. PC1000 TaxID=2746060 RepID=UPI0015F79B74|nr:glycosyltransferase [Legionella sp. PC1000]QLZ69893.1 Undecaprenyl-phosphate 4-deoxy-4-formamido-L-arabinose transferase [Legionella sp. PC1000]